MRSVCDVVPFSVLMTHCLCLCCKLKQVFTPPGCRSTEKQCQQVNAQEHRSKPQSHKSKTSCPWPISCIEEDFTPHTPGGHDRDDKEGSHIGQTDRLPTPANLMGDVGFTMSFGFEDEVGAGRHHGEEHDMQEAGPDVADFGDPIDLAIQI